MVIHLDGWGLEGWIFIGVSMEKVWSGQRCLGVAGLGGLTAAPWRRRGDQMLCNWRAHTCGEPQVSENSTEDCAADTHPCFQRPEAFS